MRAGRAQSLHPPYTVQLLNGFDSQATEYPVSQRAAEREIIAVRGRERRDSDAVQMALLVS